MKFLLVLLVVLFGVWVWRSNRREVNQAREEAEATRKAARAPQQRTAEAVEMVRCAHCGVHCPRTDAVVGRRGTAYCSDQHRGLAER